MRCGTRDTHMKKRKRKVFLKEMGNGQEAMTRKAPA